MAFSYIQSDLKQRADSSLLRVRQCVEKSGARFIELQNKRLLNFASNDYLGLGDK